jgi:guanylate kinase
LRNAKVIATPEFEFILPPPRRVEQVFTADELAAAEHAFVILSGKGAVGKTSVGERLCRRFPTKFRWCPEVMTRAARPDETPGVHLIPYSEAEFDAGLRRGEFFLAYRHRSRDKRVALKIDTLKQAILDFRRSGRRAVLVTAAPVFLVLHDLFPGARLFVVLASPADHLRNQWQRGLSPADSAEQNDYGLTIPFFEIPEAVRIWNRRHHLDEAVDAVVRRVLGPPTTTGAHPFRKPETNRDDSPVPQGAPSAGEDMGASPALPVHLL